MFSKLRIAMSVLFSLLAVALFALWMRSYHSADTVYPGRVIGTSEQGEIAISWSSDRTPAWQWIYVRPVVAWTPSNKNYLLKAGPLFRWSPMLNGVSVHFPHWSVLLLTIGLAICPWLRARFSLRTLLVATSLVAVMLGTGACVAR